VKAAVGGKGKSVNAATKGNVAREAVFAGIASVAAIAVAGFQQRKTPPEIDGIHQ
jgi:hypothetical protein